MSSIDCYTITRREEFLAMRCCLPLNRLTVIHINETCLASGKTLAKIPISKKKICIALLPEFCWMHGSDPGFLQETKAPVEDSPAI
jgi:hypothetical protein